MSDKIEMDCVFEPTGEVRKPCSGEFVLNAGMVLAVDHTWTLGRDYRIYRRREVPPQRVTWKGKEYEYTGEMRCAKNGEYFLNVPVMQRWPVDCVLSSGGKYPIYRPITPPLPTFRPKIENGKPAYRPPKKGEFWLSEPATLVHASDDYSVTTCRYIYEAVTD